MTSGPNLSPDNRVRKNIVEELGAFAIGKVDIKKFPEYKKLRSCLLPSASPDQRENAIDLIYRRYIRGYEFKHIAIHTSLLSSITGMIQLEIYKNSAKEDFSQTRFIRTLVAHILSEVKFGKSEMAIVMELYNQILHRGNNPFNSFEGMPIDEFRYCGEAVLRAQALIGRCAMGLSEEQGSPTEERAEELRFMADELFTNMIQSWQYSIRQSIWEDSFFHADQQAWVVLDHRQFKGLPEDLRDNLSHVIAYFLIATDKNHIGSTQATAESYTQDECRKVSLDIPFDYCNALRLCNDGDLYLTTNDIPISLRRICEKNDKSEAYEFLRLTLIGHLFDLVVPRKILEQTPAFSRIKDIIKNAHIRGSSLIEGIRELITPRTMIIRNPDVVRQAHQEEMNDLDNQEKQTRQFFGRVGHPKKLPQGYKPHPDAKKWAKEDGFHRELDDNETWCRTIDSPVPVVHRQKIRGEKHSNEEI